MGKEGRVPTIDGVLGTMPPSSRTEGSVELSDGESSKSPVGSDIMDTGTWMTGSVEGRFAGIKCSSEGVSCFGMGIVDKIGSSWACFGATRCGAFKHTKVDAQVKDKPCPPTKRHLPFYPTLFACPGTAARTFC